MSGREKVIEVVASLMVRNKKILACQRKEDDVFGLMWEFPGGKVKDGETYEAALTREMEEELGVQVGVGRLVGVFLDRYKDNRIKVYLYETFIKEGNLEARECRDFSFFRLRDLQKLNLAPADKKIATFLEDEKNQIF